MDSKAPVPPSAPRPAPATPYSFAVKYKEPVPDGFATTFLNNVKSLCSKYPTSPTGQKLPGVTIEFKKLFQGFAGQFHPEVVKELQKETRVTVIPDAVLEKSGFGPYVSRDTNNWALGEISRDVHIPFDHLHPPFKYQSSQLGGKGVTIWILDGGCDNHPTELEKPRVEELKEAIPPVVVEKSKPGIDNELIDFFQVTVSHGTDVAATAAGKTLGAAPEATVRAIKIGSDSAMIPMAVAANAALEYIAVNDKTPHLSVINCSFNTRGGTNQFARALLRINVEKMLNYGYCIVVSAGNGEQKMIQGQEVTVGKDITRPTDNMKEVDSNLFVTYPASIPGVLAVGAVGQDTRPTSWSNYGKPVEIWAPGTEIPSVGNVGTTTHGTSFSAPLVSGVVACILAEAARNDPTYIMKPDKVKAKLLEWGVKGVDGHVILHNGAK